MAGRLTRAAGAFSPMFDDVDDAPTPADSAERLAFLSGTSFFGGLPAPLAERLAALGHQRRFSAGDTVVSEGEPGKAVDILGSGELILPRHRGGTGEADPPPADR